MKDRAFIRYFTCVFLSHHIILTSVTWPWSLIYFLKTLTLVITYEPWETGLSYFTCEFLVTRPFTSHHNIWPSDLEFEVWPTFKKTLTLVITYEPWEIRLSHLTGVFLVTPYICTIIGRIAKQFWLMDWWCPVHLSVRPSVNIWLTLVKLFV